MSSDRPDGNSYYNPNTDTWEPLSSMGFTPGVDFELYGDGPFMYNAYEGNKFLGSGQTKTRLGLTFAMYWFLLKNRRWSDFKRL